MASLRGDSESESDTAAGSQRPQKSPSSPRGCPLVRQSGRPTDFCLTGPLQQTVCPASSPLPFRLCLWIGLPPFLLCLRFELHKFTELRRTQDAALIITNCVMELPGSPCCPPPPPLHLLSLSSSLSHSSCLLCRAIKFSNNSFNFLLFKYEILSS